jgi:hypothetical protein
MKNYILIMFLSTMILHATAPLTTSPSVTVVTTEPQGDKELAWVDDQIRAIIPTRVGVPDGFVNSLRDPMKMNQALPTLTSGSKLLAPPKLGSDMSLLPKVIEEPLRLSAIMNQSVLINGKWYKVGDNIRTFSLTEIKPNSVLLTGKKDQKLILFLAKQNSNIKIITK